jgi:nucleotide-binding universal stress UspA family protein
LDDQIILVLEKGRRVMKILIAYDGSSCSEAALDDLQNAGLPDEAEGLVISVAEVWLPPPPKNKILHQYAINLQTHRQPLKVYETGAKAVTEAETFVCHAKKRIQRIFPKWKVSAAATYGSPAWEIVTRAAHFKADLIVVGSHGRSAINRLLLGSVSQKVLTEAHSSVRVSRGHIEIAPYPVRVMIGFDGSPGATAAVEAVASRNWRKESEFRLVTASDPVTPSAIGRFIPPVAHMVEEINLSERKCLEELAEPCLKRLREAGLKATLHLYAGNPKKVLVEEAENWQADAIFVGANAEGRRLEQFFLGSVSAAVAARAHCSVEAVRKHSSKRQNKNNSELK